MTLMSEVGVSIFKPDLYVCIRVLQKVCSSTGGAAEADMHLLKTCEYTFWATKIPHGDHKICCDLLGQERLLIAKTTEQGEERSSVRVFSETLDIYIFVM